jgi:hypothetical protein
MRLQTNSGSFSTATMFTPMRLSVAFMDIVWLVHFISSLRNLSDAVSTIHVTPLFLALSPLERPQMET